MKRRFSVLFALALGIGLIAAGCGGDDDGGEALTKEQFIAQADQICQQGDERIQAEFEERFTGPDAQPGEETFTEFVEEVAVPEVQRQLDEIGDLSAPEGDEEQIESFLDAAQDGLDELEENPDAITAEEQPEGFAEAERLAREYGLENCGQEQE